MRVCAACLSHIKINELLRCTKCGGQFHYSCVKIKQDYYRAKLHELERTWICPECNILTRPVTNDDTPVRSLRSHAKPIRHATKPTLDTTITLQSQNQTCTDSATFIDEYIDNDYTIIGDTQHPNTDTTTNSSSKEPSNVTLDQISKLLDQKLATNTAYILTEISEIKSSVQKEINSAISKLQREFTDFKQDTNTKYLETKTEINEIQRKVIAMEKENTELRQKISELNTPTLMNKEYPKWANSKKFVMYGLEEYGENENDLHDRIIRIFRDILNINLTGYIEDFARIGKKGYKRPLMIEIISKRMTKYILRSSQYFKNTGLAVSDYLTDNDIETRRKLREIQIQERKKGNHATIRNNKLFVEGREYTSMLKKPTDKNMTQSFQSDQQNPSQQISAHPTPCSITTLKTNPTATTTTDDIVNAITTNKGNLIAATTSDDTKQTDIQGAASLSIEVYHPTQDRPKTVDNPQKNTRNCHIKTTNKTVRPLNHSFRSLF